MAGKCRIRRISATLVFAAAGVAATSTGSLRAQKPARTAATVAEAPGWTEVRTPHFVVASNAGEAAARGVASNFEQIRALFHATFPELRVDPLQPITIVVARDEATMRTITPEEWGGPEHVHPSGVFHSDGEKDHVVLRLDAEGTTAFHTSYHEYTHALLHLNFSRLPLWVREGVAEFFGNSLLSEARATTGIVDRAHVYTLAKSEWLPMETLLQVSETSPFYNEKNPASVFYAESWATVHYLLLDPEARRKDLLKKYLVAWDSGADAVSAGRSALGNLDTFETAVKKYARQSNWRPGLVLPGLSGLQDVSWTARTLAPAEVLAMRGDYFTHHQMMNEARPLLEEAAKTGPGIAATHQALGFFYFRNSDFADAQEQMERAIALGTDDFIPYFVLGSLQLRNVAEPDDELHDARRNLERAADLNPMFAPTFEALTQAYSRSSDTQAKALVAAETAVKLDARSRTYRTNLAYALLNNGRTEQAHSVAQSLETTAESEEEKRLAKSVLDAIADEQEWQKAGMHEGVTREFGPPGGETVGAAGSSAENSAVSPDASAPVARRQLGPPEWMAVDGSIAGIDCARSPEMTLTLNLPRGPMDFHAKDFGAVSVSGQSAAAVPAISTCNSWTGRNVKIWFRMAQGQGFLGEIMRVYFY
jgi:tetratricopeptide (TPR) repeat protein